MITKNTNQPIEKTEKLIRSTSSVNSTNQGKGYVYQTVKFNQPSKEIPDKTFSGQISSIRTSIARDG